jgi:hypothetical protein
MGYHIGRAVTKPCVSLPLYITNSNFMLREWVHQLKLLGTGRCRFRQWLQDTGWRTRIKGSGCGLFRIDKLGASAKVTLVMDSSICVAFLAVWSVIGHPVGPWPKTRNATDCPGSRIKVSMWRTTGKESACGFLYIARYIASTVCGKILLNVPKISSLSWHSFLPRETEY